MGGLSGTESWQALLAGLNLTKDTDMNHSSRKSAASFALIASSLALAALATAAEAPKGASGKAVSANDKVHCYNVHDCKGNSDCKTAEHSCKGQNACKGHGFKAMTAKQCMAKDGTIGDL